jgi:hypothetical protein
LARELIRQVETVSLRAVEALHVASASSLSISRFAPSGRILTDAARLDMIIHYFND